MKTSEIAVTTVIIAAAIILTALLSTASLRAAGAGGTVEQGPAAQGKASEQVARGKYLVQNLAALSDSDIRALFAYLQSLAPIKNRTPQPVEPPDSK